MIHKYEYVGPVEAERGRIVEGRLNGYDLLIREDGKWIPTVWDHWRLLNYVWRVDVVTQLLRYHYFVAGGPEVHDVTPERNSTREIIGVTRVRELPGWGAWTDAKRRAYIEKHLSGCHYHD